MIPITIVDLKQAARHAIGTYLIWIPMSVVYIVAFVIGGMPFFFLIVEIFDHVPPIVQFLLLSISTIGFLASYLAAFWITVYLSLRFPWPIRGKHPLYFTLMSTAMYILLLLCLGTLLRILEPQGIIAWILFLPFSHNGSVNIPVWLSVFGMCICTYIVLKRQRTK